MHRVRRWAAHLWVGPCALVFLSMSAGLQLKAHADNPPPGDSSEDAADVEPTLDKADIESTLTPRRLFPQNYNRKVRQLSRKIPQCEAQTPVSKCTIEDGVTYLCQDPAKGNPRGVTLNEFMVPHPNEHRFWPGAFVELDTLDKYMPTLVPPAEHARPPFFVGITSSAVGAEACLASAHPRYVRRCISKLLEAAGDTTPAKLDIRITEASTSEEAAASLGFSLEGAVGSIEAMFDTSSQTDTNVYFALLQQEMYSVYVDTPSGGTCHLSSEAPETKVGDESLPLGYISEITYGRMALLRVETSMTKSQLSAQLAAKSDYWAVAIEADGKVGQSKDRKEMETTWLIRGGSIHQASQAVQSGNFNELLNLESATDGSISSTTGAVPISYTVRTLADDKPVSVKLPYTVKSSEELLGAGVELLDAGVRELLEDGGFESLKDHDKLPEWKKYSHAKQTGKKIYRASDENVTFTALTGKVGYKLWSSSDSWGTTEFPIDLTDFTAGDVFTFKVSATTDKEDNIIQSKQIGGTTHWNEVRINIRFKDKYGVTLGKATAPLISRHSDPGEWYTNSVALTVPEGASQGRAWITVSRPNLTGSVFIDDVSVTTTGTGRAKFGETPTALELR